MSSNARNEQAPFTRQATILRKNLIEWDRMLRTPRGEDWPNMVGRLNAAFNQTVTLDRSIEDVMEHFVYVPRKATANPQDIPFFLSTRLEVPSDDAKHIEISGDPIHELAQYEAAASRIAAEYEENMLRF